ncbi:DUF4214 domain-containing protein [Aquihabitans sp. McL0605]|uniref:DUF4214 domain-containing protein n=1 Tax=Aquihabitans sp. McL0605 TaxID=3415671 RepID=UPI003CFB94C3
MTRTRLRLAVSGLTLAAATAVVPLAATPASAQTTYHSIVQVRATDSGGSQYAGGTGSAHVSDDGNWLAFSRLTGTGSYLKSLVSGEAELVSLNDADQPANAPSKVDGVSKDGSRVLFETAATNMGEGPATALDLYVRDLETGHTRRVNMKQLPGSQVAIAVKPGENVLASEASYVVYTATTNHVFAYQFASGLVEQIDVSSTEAQGNGGSGQPSISPDARYVTFTTSSSDFVAGDDNFVSDVFERDRQTGLTTRISLTDTEGAPNLGSDHSSVSDNGQAVAFSSTGNNLVAGDTNNSQDVFIRYLSTASTLRVSIASNLDATPQGNGDSGRPEISATGAYVVFESNADDIDYNVTANGHADVFLRDVSGALTTQIDTVSHTSGNQSASGPSYADGNGATAFNSAATNLVTADTNGAGDAFARRYESSGPHAMGLGDMIADLSYRFGIDNVHPNAVDDLYNGRLTSGRFIMELAHAPAFAKYRAPVARLYQAYFHREPDLNGLNYWITKRSKGTSLSVIAKSFATSNEFKTAYGTVDDPTFVNLVYGNVLQRKPDQPGLDYWVAKMAGGLSRGDVMVAFSESSEGQRTLSPEVDATLVGLGTLKAMPPKALWLESAKASRDHHMSEWGALVYLNSAAYETLVHP